MPRTKGSKNKPKVANDYASQIAEKQEFIASLNTEITTITANTDALKADLRGKKASLKEAEKSWPLWKQKSESGCQVRRRSKES